jgi:hypothetical protein
MKGTKKTTGFTKSKMRTTWLTPRYIIDHIGLSDLDPCGYRLNGELVVPCANKTYTQQDSQDGLTLPWEGSVYCNPPFTQNQKWIQRCLNHHNTTGSDVIVLIFCRSDTGYFQEYVSQATGINLLSGKLKYLNEEGNEEGQAQVPSVLIAYGESAFERISRVPGVTFRTCSRVASDTPQEDPSPSSE